MKNNTKIEIQFRKFKGEILAVFPYEIQNNHMVSCYAHKGQHSTCAWDLNTITKAARKEEYQDLLNELKVIYSEEKIKVIQKRNHTKYIKAYYQHKRSL